VKDFARFVLSSEGQQLVAKDGKYLPLTAAAIAQQRRLLD
jgi:phosphate transport system substrate-binding protein